jgi:hypothetical protein
MDVGQHTSFTGRTQEDSVAMRITTIVLRTLLAGAFLIIPNLAQADQDLETAKLLIKMVELGRGVISEQQTLINDATKGDKGVTADFVTGQIADRFKKQASIDLAIPNSHPSIKLLQTMLESQKEVMDGAQPMINKQGVGFKAFLPATFARRAGATFYKKTGIQVKLTSSAYRYDGNKPDDFEQEVLQVFADPKTPKGQVVSRTSMVNGKPALRVMKPEYAGTSCLSCHGNPKGERDVTGMRKEGWNEGDLAGAISIIMPTR